MKHLIILFSLMLAINIGGYCQKKAIITETGKEVELFDNGIWKYVPEDTTESNIIEKADTLIFFKSKESDYLLKSTTSKYGVWIDQKKWNYKEYKDDGTNPPEFSFRLKDEDAYGMIIAEKTEIPIDKLLEIAFLNVKKVALDAKIIKKECRKVNGIIVHSMQMEGTIKGIRFVYLAYYYSDENGSIQFLTYTSQKLFLKYKAEMESLLNGYIINK